jgi:hypothetical protein
LFGDEEAGDQVAGEDEEEVDAEVAAGEPTVEVEGDNAKDRRPAEPIEGGEMGGRIRARRSRRVHGAVLLQEGVVPARERRRTSGGEGTAALRRAEHNLIRNFTTDRVGRRAKAVPFPKLR